MEKYHCIKCNRFHYRGKIYKKHLKYMNKKKKNKSSKKINQIPEHKILNFNFKELRPIAKRQINRLISKMNKAGNHNIYVREINKVILHERMR